MLFSPRLIATTNANEKIVLNEGGLIAQSISIIPRAQSSFRRYRLKGTGKAALRAIEIQAKHEARLGHDMFIVRKDSDHQYVSVWGYSSQHASSLRRLPESLCRKSIANGVRLVKCMSGIEGQAWHDNQLVASRWWHDQHSAANWESFLRAVPIELDPSDMVMPKVESPDFRKDIPAFSMDLDNFEDVFTPTRVGTFVLCVALFFVSQFAVQNFQLKNKLSHIETQKENISIEANQILAKRRRAIANARKLQTHHAVEPKYNLIGAISAVAGTLKGQEVVIRDIRLRDGDVEFKFTGTVLLRAADIVTELEKTPSLTAVNISGSKNSLSIKAKLASPTDNIAQSPRGADQ